jgi:acid stress chaperone HdeB
MRKLAISAITLGMFCAPAYAQKMDVSVIKCRDMATHSADKNALILMWLQGYYSDEDASPIIDFDKMLRDEKKLVEYCEKNPDHSIITAADEVLDD